MKSDQEVVVNDEAEDAKREQKALDEDKECKLKWFKQCFDQFEAFIRIVSLDVEDREFKLLMDECDIYRRFLAQLEDKETSMSNEEIFSECDRKLLENAEERAKLETEEGSQNNNCAQNKYNNNNFWKNNNNNNGFSGNEEEKVKALEETSKDEAEQVGLKAIGEVSRADKKTNSSY